MKIQADSFAGQVLAVVSRRTPALRTGPDEPSTFPGRAFAMTSWANPLRRRKQAGERPQSGALQASAGTATTAGRTAPQYAIMSARTGERLPRGLSAAAAFAAVAVIVTATAIAGLLYSSPHVMTTLPWIFPPAASQSSAAAALASGQAAGVNDLLDASASTRWLLVNGITELETCSDPSGGVTLLQEVVSQRRSEVSRASALHTRALANGATLRSDLHTALSYSLRSDQADLVWARQVTRTGCTGQLTPQNASDAQAASYKNMFLQLWNPIAPQYGFQARAESSF